MNKRQEALKLKSSSKRDITVFFNASVVLAGLKSPHGGSGELLRLVKSKKIRGQISEVVLDEVTRHLIELGLDQRETLAKLAVIFGNFYPAPKSFAERFSKIVVDFGDAHLLASARENRAKYLVSLDKKHILSLKGQIKRPQIVSPAELIQILRAVN